MEKVLFATTNPAKIQYYTKELIKRGIEVVTLKELGIQLEIEENGKDAEENAKIKALAYYQKTRLTTISVDDNLYIEGLPSQKQPGNNIRRVNGKRLEDGEMLTYYTNLMGELGETAKGFWIHGIAVCKGGIVKTYHTKSERIFTTIVSPKKIEGYPLDSISIVPEYGKYRSELTKEEIEEQQHTKNKELFEFILRNIS